MTPGPDYISPIIGYRVWQWDFAGLRSLNGALWLPGKPLEAVCRVCDFARWRGSRGAARRTHNAPHMRCTCGIYASKNPEHLREHGYLESRIHGQVSLWGIVVEHQLGWRARYAYPSRFFVPPEILPITLTEIHARLLALILYRCDIFIICDGASLLLWRDDSGFIAAGLDYLVSRGNRWYARHKQETAIKQGERVAVAGLGTAVVEGIHDRWIHAVLGKQRVVRIARNHVSWNRQNVRWETDTSCDDTDCDGGIEKTRPTVRGL